MGAPLPPYPEAEPVLRSLGAEGTGLSNRLMIGEALAHGLSVDRNERGVFVVGDGTGRTHTWNMGMSDFTTPLAHLVAKYKDAASALLAAEGIVVPEHAVFGRGEADRAWAWGEKFAALVVKPVDGKQGADVHVGLAGRPEFAAAFDAVAATGAERILVEEFCSGTEHRCLLVRGEFVAATRRRPASVVGDGRRGIRALIDEKNADRGPIHLPIELDGEATERLAEAGLTPDSVPPSGQRVTLRRASNLHRGGDAIDATDELSPDEIAFVEAAARALPGGQLIGMDALLPRAAGDGAPRVLELNTKPMISMHHYPWEGAPRNAARAIIRGMFPGASAGR